MRTFTDSVGVQSVLTWLEGLGWRVTNGLAVAPSGLVAERARDRLAVPALARDCAERLQAAGRWNIES